VIANASQSVAPAVLGRRLSREMLRAREAAGKSRRDVVADLDWSMSALISIESGTTVVGVEDLGQLLGFYGVGPEHTGELVELAKKAGRPSPWDIYRKAATPAYINLCAYESSAVVIRAYEPLVIPGLLQTEGYARAVLSRWFGSEGPQKVDALVNLRRQRQKLLAKEDAPQLRCIIDESVLTRRVGDFQVMRTQLEHLRVYSDHPGVTIRVIPKGAAFSPCEGVAFTVLESGPDNESVLYLEPPTGEVFLREDVMGLGSVTPVTYLASFWELEEAASRDDFTRFVDDAIDRLTQDRSNS